MTTELVNVPIKEQYYSFALINSLKEENDKLKKAIFEVLEILNSEHGVPNLEWMKGRLQDAV